MAEGIYSVSGPMLAPVIAMAQTQRARPQRNASGSSSFVDVAVERTHLTLRPYPQGIGGCLERTGWFPTFDFSRHSHVERPVLTSVKRWKEETAPACKPEGWHGGSGRRKN